MELLVILAVGALAWLWTEQHRMGKDVSGCMNIMIWVTVIAVFIVGLAIVSVLEGGA